MALTQDQLDMLAMGDLVAKLCVEIDAATPLRYCSGEDAVTVSGELYYPRVIVGRSFALVNPSTSKTTLKLDDGDTEIRLAWYADPFSGYQVTVTMLIREPIETTWTEGAALSWHCDKGSFRGNMFELKLRSAYGHRRRFGLEVGNRSTFRRAPEPGESFQFIGGSTTVNAPYRLPPHMNPQPPTAPPPSTRRTSGRRSTRADGGRPSGRVTPG
jgi:hypothetical protein